MGEFNSVYSSIKHRKFNTWCNYTTRLDTYGCGCQHDCSYCYAKSLLNFRGLWKSSSPKVSNLFKIKESLRKHPKTEVIKLGGMTDCFMPLELEKQITYETIKILNHYKINYLIVTKSSIVTNEKYLSIYDKNLAHFQITITGTNDNECLKYEHCTTVTERIKSIETLYNLGFDVSIRLSPFIIENTDISVINSIQCNKILIEFLKVNHWVKKSFKIDYSKYSVKYGGYNHLTLDEKINQIKGITKNQISVGEYVYDHYLYFRENINFNKNDCCNLTLDIVKAKIYTQLELF